MSPVLTWLLVISVIGLFVIVGSRILRFIDDLLDTRWLRRHSGNTGWYGHHGDQPRSIRELTAKPFDQDDEAA